MAKREVKVIEIKFGIPSRYLRQWHVDASPTKTNFNPSPYTVSMPRESDMWECSCMNWTHNHPREDCKHIMRVKLQEAVPSRVQVPQSMVVVQSTGRMFR